MPSLVANVAERGSCPSTEQLVLGSSCTRRDCDEALLRLCIEDYWYDSRLFAREKAGRFSRLSDVRGGLSWQSSPYGKQVNILFTMIYLARMTSWNLLLEDE